MCVVLINLAKVILSLQDLLKDLSDKLRGDTKLLVLALMTPPAEYAATELRKAMKGGSTDETILVEILTPRSSGEIFAVRDAYRRCKTLSCV